MAEVVVWQQTSPLAQYVQKQAARHIGNMQLIAEVAKVAMDEVSNIHGYAGYKVATTLVAAEVIQKVAASGELTPDLAAASQQQAEEYLAQMSQIAQSAGAKIVGSVDQLPLENGNGSTLSALWHWLLEKPD